MVYIPNIIFKGIRRYAEYPPISGTVMSPTEIYTIEMYRTGSQCIQPLFTVTRVQWHVWYVAREQLQLQLTSICIVVFVDVIKIPSLKLLLKGYGILSYS